MSSKIRPIKGFPEWLPEQKLVEQDLLERVRKRFELHGFAPIETRSVERIEHLTQQGATDKEIYVLRRIHAEEGDPGTGFGLHFDLTVPFARYVAEFHGALRFPFRRYQIQKAWRGERPRDGRFREFYQADADVIAEGELPLHHDVDMVGLLTEVMADLPVPKVTIHVNNRKVLEGYYRALGIEDVDGAIRIVDKLDKVGPDGVREQLLDLGVSEHNVTGCLELGQVRGTDREVLRKIEQLGQKHPLLEEGLSELLPLAQLAEEADGSVVIDLSIARGLAYYTGIVYEGQIEGHQDLGAVCSGGRYADLASMGSGKKFPGIGVSVGISRILSRLLGQKMVAASRGTPSVVLVALDSAETRSEALAVAKLLRSRGICCQVFDAPVRYSKQIRYADKLGIPFVWFINGGDHEVRDVRQGEQVSADPKTWSPPSDELNVRTIFLNPTQQ